MKDSLACAFRCRVGSRRLASETETGAKLLTKLASTQHTAISTSVRTLCRRQMHGVEKTHTYTESRLRYDALDMHAATIIRLSSHEQHVHEARFPDAVIQLESHTRTHIRPCESAEPNRYSADPNRHRNNRAVTIGSAE